MTIGGIQDSVKYTLTAPDGSVATFNDPADANYVGMARWTGLDDAEVVEVADQRTAADGGVHGDFWRGRRPIVGNIEVVPTSATDRNTKYDRLMKATNALRGDSVLKWTPDGSAEQFVRVRKNGPVRRAEEPGWLTKFQVPLVSADPFKYSTTLNTGTTSPVTNAGNAPVFPVIRIDGPSAVPRITLTNTTTNERLHLEYEIPLGSFLEVDFAARTVLLNGVTNLYSAIQGAPEWWALQPGSNSIAVTYTIENTAGFNSPDIGATGGGAGIAWTSPGNVLTSDNVRATAAVNPFETTETLNATDFDFAIPAGAVITGIEVEVEKLTSVAFAGDAVMSIIKGGVVKPLNLAGSGKVGGVADIGFWPVAETYVTYGGNGQLWGETWTSTDINALNFGAAHAGYCSSSGPTTLSIDHMRIKVYYETSTAVSGWEIDWRDAWL
jgi:hypothetical protein